jgi:hypothetical protein
METVLILGSVLVVGFLIFAGAQNQHRRPRHGSGGDSGAIYSGGDGGCDAGSAGCDGGGGGA